MLCRQTLKNFIIVFSDPTKTMGTMPEHENGAPGFRLTFGEHIFCEFLLLFHRKWPQD